MIGLATKGIIKAESRFPSMSEIAEAVWDANSVDHTTVGTMGEFLKRIKIGTNNRMAWDSVNSRFVIYNDDDVSVFGYMEVVDKDNNDVVMQGTGPVSRTRIQ